jgi:hypothetical protein
MELNDRLYTKLSEMYSVPKKEVVLIFEVLFTELKKHIVECEYDEIRLKGIGAFKRKWINLHFRQMFSRQHISWRRFNKQKYNKHLQKWKNKQKS